MSKRRFEDYPDDDYGSSRSRGSGRSRFGSDFSIPPPPPPPPAPSMSRSNSGDSNGSTGDDSGRVRKRKSRWATDDSDRVFIPGMPTIIPSNLTKEQEQIYLLQIQIEELTRSIAAGLPNDHRERSPSPEPIYNSEGKRLNTREYRYRKKLEEKRHGFVVKMLESNPNYKPPADYRPPQTKIFEKVLIPQEEHPDINFVGLIIGPRGNTLKSMERDSTAKIIIRGKGSVKEGKLARKDGQPMPGEDEPLHAFVSGPTHEAVAMAVARIKEVIRKGIDLPENQNDLRRSQLRELALLNGTLREHDGPKCTNCGSNAHRSWQCPDKPNITNNVFCTNCNSAGHIARDCREAPASGADKANMDEEYLSFMAELGEGNGPANGSGADRKGGGGYGSSSYSQSHQSQSYDSNANQNNSGYGGRFGNRANNGGSSIPQPPPPPPPPPGYGQDTKSTPPPPPPPSQSSYSGYQQTSQKSPIDTSSSTSNDANSQAWAQYYAAAAAAGGAAGYADPYSQAYAGYDWSQYAAWYGSQPTAASADSSSGVSVSSAASQQPPPPPPPPSQAYAQPPPPPPRS